MTYLAWFGRIMFLFRFSHPARFGSSRVLSNKNLNLYLNFSVVKWSWNHVAWWPQALILNVNPWKFGDYKIYGRGDKMSLIWNVTSRDYVRKGSFDSIVDRPLPLLYTLPNLVVVCLVEEEIESFWFVVWHQWPNGQRLYDLVWERISP